MAIRTLKFNRIAKLKLGDRLIEGVRFEFEVKRGIGGFSPFSTLTVYNLNPTSRTLAATRGTPIQIIVGYQGSESTLFAGNIATGFTVKDNADLITTIHAADFLDITTKQINLSIKNPNNLVDVINVIAKNAGIAIGEIDMENKNFVNSLTFSSSFIRTLNKLSSSFHFTWYILNQKLFCYGNDRQTQKRKFIFDVNSGLLSTPIQSNLGIDVQVLLESSINQFDTFDAVPSVDFVQVQAGTRFGDQVNKTAGTQRVLAVTHNGDTHTNKWVSNIRGENLRSATP